MATILHVLCFTVFPIFGMTDANFVTIQTNGGAVRGTTETVFGEEVHIFKGIPYAEPPVGSRRFKAPKAKEGWEGTIDAIEQPPACYQSKGMPGVIQEVIELEFDESEDCLFINIWAPSSNTQKPRAVMVWIHGGAFTIGTTALKAYEGHILAARHDVVVVSMQYRLNILGFLYLGTEEAPGNMGLMDQQMALKWIKNNIAAFNGDPTRVTIFGESAGAASVEFHILTPGSKGLFHNAILESGSTTAPWAIFSKEDHAELVQTMIGNLDCDPNDDAYTCLMNQEPEELTQDVDPDSMVTFPPVVDGSFIPRPPRELLQSGDFTKTNVLAGTNRDEGTFYLPFRFNVPETDDLDPNTVVSKQRYDKFLESHFKTKDSNILRILSATYGVPATGATSAQMKKAIGDMLTDTLFLCPHVTSLEAFKQHNLVVYNYLYANDPPTTMFPSWMGATHVAELVDVFGLAFTEYPGNSEEEKKFSDLVMGYWTNFAKTGNPNQGDFDVPMEWLPHTADEYQYIVLQTPEVAMRKGYKEGHCKVLDEISGLKPVHEEL